AAENTEKSHVSFDEGHVHEASLDKSHELFVHAQSDICRREDYCLRILDFCFLNRDILVKCDSSISPEEPVHPDYLLPLILRISWPSNRNSRPFSVHVDEVAGGYGELLHCLVIDPDLPVPDIPLFGISDSQLHFLWHSHCISSLTVLFVTGLRRSWMAEVGKLVLTFDFIWLLPLKRLIVIINGIRLF